jgi:hypothetical protein
VEQKTKTTLLSAQLRQANSLENHFCFISSLGQTIYFLDCTLSTTLLTNVRAG